MVYFRSCYLKIIELVLSRITSRTKMGQKLLQPLRWECVFNKTDCLRPKSVIKVHSCRQVKREEGVREIRSRLQVLHCACGGVEVAHKRLQELALLVQLIALCFQPFRLLQTLHHNRKCYAQTLPVPQQALPFSFANHLALL